MRNTHENKAQTRIDPKPITPRAGVIDPETRDPGRVTPMATTRKKGPPKAAPKPAPRFGKGQPVHYCGVKGRSGPATANTNALRHGLTAANLPKSCRYIYHRLNNLRRTLETLLVESKGEVGMADGATIQTILRWERAAQLAERYFRLEGAKLGAVVAQGFVDKAADASEKRDKAIARLKLDRDLKDNLLESLYRLPSPESDANGKGTTDEAIA